MTLDLDKIATMLAIADTTEHEGERSTAIRMAGKALRAAGTTWQELLTPYRELETASLAAAQLLAENDQLRAALARAEASNGSVPWQDVSVASPGNHRAAARWALDLHREGAIWLSAFETRFLDRCTTWTGSLTPKMRPIFDSIMQRIIERTGLRPPP